MGYFRNDGRASRAWAEEMLALATEQGFAHWQAEAMIFHGWAMARQGYLQEGQEQHTEGLAAWRATGAGLSLPYWLALLTETQWWAGQYDAGLHTVAEALTVGAHNHEPWWDAPLYALQGELILAQHGITSPPDEVEACFHQALTIARQQQARSLELRAAVSLARLWQQQGKHTEARDLLAPVYRWFTESLIRQTSRRPKHCWTSWHESMTRSSKDGTTMESRSRSRADCRRSTSLRKLALAQAL